MQGRESSFWNFYTMESMHCFCIFQGNYFMLNSNLWNILLIADKSDEYYYLTDIHNITLSWHKNYYKHCKIVRVYPKIRFWWRTFREINHFGDTARTPRDISLFCARSRTCRHAEFSLFSSDSLPLFSVSRDLRQVVTEVKVEVEATGLGERRISRRR